MSQNSILELLSVTNNAVKALDKTTSSKSSGSGGSTPRTGRTKKDDAENRPPLVSQEVHDNSKSSADSGVGKTVTQSNQARSLKESGTAAHDSDDSTTVSDGVIHSAHGDKGPTNQAVAMNTSASSQGSRCRELDNFNVADAKNVKVSKKQLREIVSPQSSADSANQSGLGHGKTYLNMNNNNQNPTHQPSNINYKSESGKVINGGFSRKDIPNTKFKTTSTGNENNKIFLQEKRMLSQGLDSGGIVCTVERHEPYPSKVDAVSPDAKANKGHKIESRNLNPASQQLSQFPYKVSRHGSTTKEQVLVEPEDLAEDWDEQSMNSDQPEIVTVPERVVNISSQALLLSDYDDDSSQGSAVDVVSAANRPSQPQSFPNPRPKLQGPGLKQGALTQGPAVPKAGKGDEVEISKFSLTEKQRELREALSKRGSQSKPVKRVVHPKMVYSSASSVSDEGLNKNNNMDTGEGSGGGVGNVESITAAVAASAAVAVTQPFLKMQQDMESKMQSLLAEMDRVQKQVATTGTAESSGQVVPNPRLEYLEQQVKELTERRLQHLEILQTQQMHLQAHLLSMSRDMSQQQHSSSRHPTYFPSISTAHPAPSYNPMLIERELMRGRLQQEDRGHGYEQWRADPVKPAEVTESVLTTPNPRSRPPRPAQFDGAKGGLLQEILASDPSPQLNTTFNLPPGQAPAANLRTSRRRRDDGASPVEKARKLVHDLSNLEDQTAESIWSDAQPKSKSKMVFEEPAPLEYYLKRVRDTNTTPYSKLGKSQHRSRSSSPSKTTPGTSKMVYSVQAPVQDKYMDARNVLNSVTTERETLEKNLELMLRSRQDVDVYSLMAGVTADRSEMTRIQKMVEKRISSLKDEVKREVAWDLQHNVGAAKSASFQDLIKKSAHGGMATRPAVGFGSGAPRMSKIDTGLHKSRSTSDALSMAGKGKRIIKAKPAPKKSKIPYGDEGVMTQIYGKAQYQKGRTTVKDPYLHFQNQAKHRTSRVPSPKRPDSVINVKSSKIQAGGATSDHPDVSSGQREGGAPRQFYFSPTRGYVPITSSTSAPVVGQLVPMAIPLGKPRMDPGLAVGPEEQSVSMQPSGSARPVVTAATNVAMVSIRTEADGPMRERVPELGKQVLPAVDIDSLSPASSPRGSDDQIKDPDSSRNAGYLQTFHYQEESEEDEEEGEKTLTEDASDEEQQGVGISLPGYHQPTPAREMITADILDRASRTTRPPKGSSQLREQGEVPWEERCDEFAEDLRIRDVLHNKAKYWLEQELMARMLMKMYPVMSDLATQQPEQEDVAVADCSDSIPDDESLLVGDTIGQKGLQLFVDAGQPVNNNLVNALVREVIAEKVGSMLGRRQEDSADSRVMATKSQTRGATGGTAVDDLVSEETQFVRPSRQAERVPTPQPTPPCTSPIPGFISQHAPVTPPLTPPPPPIPPRERSPAKDMSSESSAPAAALVSATTSMTQQLEPAPQNVYESETEISASLDISEELRVLDDKMKQAQAMPAAAAASHHEIPTPTTTPPPTPPPMSVQLQTITTTTPTPSPPPVQPVTPPPPPPVEPATTTAALQLEVTAKERESRSPQPWGNPDSPGPELNPNFEEPSELGHTQPRPLMMSVAVGTDVITAEQHRSPSPQHRRKLSEDQSALESLSSPSSTSDTFNDNISEGQWLVSRSEGQAAGLPIDDDIHRRAVEAVRKVDTSTASTLRDTEDLDLDDTDVSHSEGEFLHKGDILNPETDPVLALLMQMQHQPGGFRQYDLPVNRVQQVLSSSSRSTGEISRNGGQVSMRKSVGELSEGQVYPGAQVMVVTPKMASPPPQETGRSRQRSQGEVVVVDRARSSSPGTQRSTNIPHSRTPPGPRNRQQQYQPVNSGLPPSHSNRRPLKSALVRSSDSRHSRDSEQDSDSRGPPTEYGTRTLTPDQLNTEALLQSGTYLTRSMGSSGRQGSTKKSVEFDLSGTYEMSHRKSSFQSDDVYSSTAGSSDRLSTAGRSLGLNYSFEYSESEREKRSAGLRMSVTIPSTEGGSESDVSEIDLSENTGP